MFEIDKTLVSDEIFTEYFYCDLGRCKGCCCIEGDAGAPLEMDELGLLEKHFPVFKKYMTVEGLLAVAAGGLWDTQENQVGVMADARVAGAADVAYSADAICDTDVTCGATTETNKQHLVTPINGSDCVYLYQEKNGTAKCAIEKAYLSGEIKDFQKPISCHLFPIRITAHENYDAVNYFEWNICKDAVKKGKEAGVPIFRFLKEPLIRKYGKEWYQQAEEIYTLLKS
jgi:hypothetical protein